MDEKQQDTAQRFVEHIKLTNPKAIGVAFLVLGCGCLQGGPFDENGDQVGPVKHLLTQSSGDSITICQECMMDGGAPERVTGSALLFFEPDRLTTAKKHWISSKIFSETPLEN